MDVAGARAQPHDDPDDERDLADIGADAAPPLVALPVQRVPEPVRHEEQHEHAVARLGGCESGEAFDAISGRRKHVELTLELIAFHLRRKLDAQIAERRPRRGQ